MRSAVLDALTQIVPDEDQPRLANIETMLTGFLLGQDLRTKVLPRLGPGILAYLDAPSETDEQESCTRLEAGRAGGLAVPAGHGDQPGRSIRSARGDTVNDTGGGGRQRPADGAGHGGDGREASPGTVADHDSRRRRHDRDDPGPADPVCLRGRPCPQIDWS